MNHASRRANLRLSITLASTLAAWGCGSREATTDTPDDDTGAEADASAAGAGATKTSADPMQSVQEPDTAGIDFEWETLLKGEWKLPPSTEDYVCVRQTVEEVLYVRAFEAINPLGTHHTFLSMGEPSGPDGVTPCSANENHAQSIFGSGVGTNALELPDGVAIKVEAGTQILLNLHLFNASTEELRGLSGTKMVRADEADVEQLGGNIAAGVLSLELPPRQMSSKTGTCMIRSDTTIFGVLPHMHQLGVHMKVVAESSVDGERVLHDDPYDFDEQLFYPIDPIQMAAGDAVRFECTWLNTTDKVVGFGDSSLDEMCFVGLYRYPTDGADFCVSR